MPATVAALGQTTSATCQGRRTWHTDRDFTDDLTIGACGDADRLDLGRVGGNSISGVYEHSFWSRSSESWQLRAFRLFTTSMKPVAAVCALSLAVNLGFVGYMALSPRGAISTASEKPVTSESSTDGGLSAETRQLLVKTGIENLELLRDRLRAEGLPESIVRDVVSHRLWAARQAKIDAADPIKKRPWWQQTSEQLPGDDVRVTRLAESSRIEVLARINELFTDLKEDDVDPEATFLPVAKQRALQKLRKDYAELHRRLDAETGSYLSSSDLNKQQYLQGEEAKDMKALLTPAEHDELGLRNLAALSDHKKTAAIFDLSEGQFRGLLAIEQRVAREYEKLGPPANDPFAARSPEQDAAIQKVNEEARQQRLELIGTEKRNFYEAVEADKGEYESLARYVARYELPPAKVKEYYDFFRQWGTEQQPVDEGLSRTEQRQAFMALLQKIEAPMIELMGPAIMDSDLSWVQFIRTVKPHEQ